MSIRLTLPVPPSDNAIYTTIMIGKGKRKFPKRQLTKEARAYKKKVATMVAGMALKTTASFQPNVKYECLVKVFFEKVYNRGWPKTAKTRYKREDAQDRIKLVTDSVSEAIGIDDSHHFITKIQKDEDTDDPRIVIVIREQEPRNGDEG